MSLGPGPALLPPVGSASQVGGPKLVNCCGHHRVGVCGGQRLLRERERSLALEHFRSFSRAPQGSPRASQSSPRAASVSLRRFYSIFLGFFYPTFSTSFSDPQRSFVVLSCLSDFYMFLPATNRVTAVPSGFGPHPPNSEKLQKNLKKKPPRK